MNWCEWQMVSHGQTVDYYKCIHCCRQVAAPAGGTLPTDPCDALEHASELCSAQPRGYVHEYSVDDQLCRYCKVPAPKRPNAFQRAVETSMAGMRPSFAPQLAPIPEPMSEVVRRLCVCPMHGPTGLMAQGCTCGSVRR